MASRILFVSPGNICPSPAAEGRCGSLRTGSARTARGPAIGMWARRPTGRCRPPPVRGAMTCRARGRGRRRPRTATVSI